MGGFLRKSVMVLAVILAISGFFIHYHSKDLPRPERTDYREQFRSQLYDTIHDEEVQSARYGPAIIAVVRTSLCVILGEGCTDNPEDGDTMFNDSLLGFVSNAIALPYANPPASGMAWVSDGLKNAGFIPDTYAAGVGFYTLSPFNEIWKLFRNITLFLMALAIVIVGFLIMFRYQIDSNTVISVENSLPRIVVTLLMITFSFAIAGFLIDVMYVVIIISLSLLGSLNPPDHELGTKSLQAMYLTAQAPMSWADGRYLYAYVDALHGLFNLIPEIVRLVVIGIAYFYSYQFMMGALSRMFGWVKVHAEAGPLALFVGGDIAGILFWIVFTILLAIFVPIIIYWIIPLLLGSIIMLFLFFRIFFMLVASYLQLVINVIFAPVLILPNVIPGNESFKNWLKRIVGHLLVFPVTIILLVVVQLIALNDQSLNGTGANPREFTQFTLPLIYMETSQFVPIIAGAFLLLIPDLVKKVRDSVAGDSIIQAGPSVLFSGLDTAVGAAFGQYTGLAAVNRTFAGQGPLGKVLNRFYEGKKDRTSTTPPAAIDPAGGNN